MILHSLDRVSRRVVWTNFHRILGWLSIKNFVVTPWVGIEIHQDNLYMANTTKPSHSQAPSIVPQLPGNVVLVIYKARRYILTSLLKPRQLILCAYTGKVHNSLASQLFWNWFPRYETTLSITFLINNFMAYFTLISKCFSSFAHATCSLSVFGLYLELREIYPALYARFPTNMTL